MSYPYHTYIDATSKEYEVSDFKVAFSGYHNVPFRFGYTWDFGRLIEFGEQKHTVVVPDNVFRDIRNAFRNRTPPLGASRTNPTPGSIGEFMQQNYPRYHIVTSYIGAIIVNEGYARWVDDNTLTFVR